MKKSKYSDTMQYPLAVQVCRRLATTVEQMLYENKEIGSEHWESLLESARRVVEMADNAPADEKAKPVRPKRATTRLVHYVAVFFLGILLSIGVYSLMVVFEDSPARVLTVVDPIPEPPAEEVPPEATAQEHQPPAVVEPEKVEVEVIDIPKTAEPEETGFGLVDVGITGGWAKVYIDGREIRSTPLLAYRLKAGNHMIELRDANGNKVTEWNIRLKPDQRLKLLHQPVSPEVSPKSEEIPEPTAETPSGFGYLVVNTRPWAKVYVDGSNTGRSTPIPPGKALKLPVGKRKITFEIPSGELFNFEVTIEEGKEFRMIRRLETTR